MQVEVSGTEYPLPSSEQMQVSLLVNQLRVNFTKGKRVTLRAFAVNSVGTSDPVSADVIVPCELLYRIYIVHAGLIGGWSVCMWVLCISLYCGGMDHVWHYLFMWFTVHCSPSQRHCPPTELSTTNIPVCCVGVQLNLANPDNLTDVRVIVDGTPHHPNQVTRNGSFLYIMGLQAGTEYSLNITLTNILGTVWVNTTVRPLLGELYWAHCNAHLLIPPPPSPLPQAVPPPHKWPSPPLLVD